MLPSLRKIRFGWEEGCVIFHAMGFPEGKTKQCYQANTPGKGFSDPFHHFKLLGTAHIELPFASIAVKQHFYLLEQCGCFLNFIHENRRRVIFEKRSFFFFRACADDRIVKCDIVYV